MQIHLGLYRKDKGLADHQNPIWGRLRGEGNKSNKQKSKNILEKSRRTEKTLREMTKRTKNCLGQVLVSWITAHFAEGLTGRAEWGTERRVRDKHSKWCWCLVLLA